MRLAYNKFSTHSLRRQKSRGFTIIELLIVIVVIAILAAIVIVSYTGVQQRAVNTRTIASVRQYLQKISLYRAEHSGYPAVPSGSGGVCLGYGYKDRVGGDGIGDCGETAYPLKEDKAFSIELLEGSATVVNDQLVKMPYQSSSWVGAAFHNYGPDPSRSSVQDQLGMTVGGVSAPYYVMYVLSGGNAKCSLPGLVKPDETQFGWPKMTDKLDGQTWSWSDGVSTACVISLAN